MTILSRVTTFAVAASAGVAFAAFLGAAPLRAAAPPAMRMSYVQGDVQIKPSSSEDYGPASVNQPVSEGDQLWLPQGGLSELQMRTGAFLRLDQNSAAQILTATKENALQVSLTQGHAYVFYDAPKGGSIQIDTPKHSIKAFENAVFRVDLSEKTDTIGVLDGNVEVETLEGMKRVGRGQMLTFAEDGSVDIGPAGRPDDWENWNNQRNAAHAPKKGDPSKDYLPKELQTYSGDFSSGKWVETKEHGHAWRPGDVDDDWTPYDNGRWVLYEDEYAWVGYESWGWAPYHYGRWIYIAGEGWLWIPPDEDDVYWAPGYVAWYETDGYIGWAPLWPGEYYYGYGNYGHYSVDIHVHGGDHRHHYDHYHHFGDHHGMKVVTRDNFMHYGGGGRHGYRYEKAGYRAFGDKGAAALRAGGPSRGHGHGQHFAVERHIGQDKAPPSRIANLRTADLKGGRSLSRRSGQSSFSPGAAPGRLRARTVRRQRPFAGSHADGGRHYHMSKGAGPRMANRFRSGHGKRFDAGGNHGAMARGGVRQGRSGHARLDRGTRMGRRANRVGSRHNFGSGPWRSRHGASRGRSFGHSGHGRSSLGRRGGFGRNGGLRHNGGFGRNGGLRHNGGFGRSGGLRHNGGFGRSGGPRHNGGFGQSGGLRHYGGSGRSGGFRPSGGGRSGGGFKPHSSTTPFRH
jgi:hypothetical protein